MRKLFQLLAVSLLSMILLSGCKLWPWKKSTTKSTADNAQKKDAGHSRDYRTFHASGVVDFGKINDSYNANLVMYLAGNQFMVMKELIQDFQRKNPTINTVYVETIPPGQILKGQLLKQGQVDGKDTNRTPDLFASVNIKHLKVLRSKGIMKKYIVYTHNKLELMVAKGNPKRIKRIEDLARDDLVQSHPNPLTEGIFKFYGSVALKKAGIYNKVTGGKKCKGCWAIPNKTWFTTRHHRETPDRIEKGLADVGIVWTTEVAYARKQGRAIDGVPIRKAYNMQSKVSYAIGPLTKAKNKKNALRFIRYLGSKDAQNIYAKYGFIKAKRRELRLRWVPRLKKKRTKKRRVAKKRAPVK